MVAPSVVGVNGIDKVGAIQRRWRSIGQVARWRVKSRVIIVAYQVLATEHTADVVFEAVIVVQYCGRATGTIMPHSCNLACRQSFGCIGIKVAVRAAIRIVAGIVFHLPGEVP